MSLTYPYLLSRHPKATTDHDVSLDHYVDICGLRLRYLAADEEPGPGHRGGRDRPQHCAHDGAAAGAGPGRQVRPNRWHLGGPAVDQLILAPLHINVHSDKGEGAAPPTGLVLSQSPRGDRGGTSGTGVAGRGCEEAELYTVTLRHRSTDQAVYNRIKTIRSGT